MSTTTEFARATETTAPGTARRIPATTPPALPADYASLRAHFQPQVGS
mgnify:CR=1 FL=1